MPSKTMSVAVGFAGAATAGFLVAGSPASAQESSGHPAAATGQVQTMSGHGCVKCHKHHRHHSSGVATNVNINTGGAPGPTIYNPNYNPNQPTAISQPYNPMVNQPYNPVQSYNPVSILPYGYGDEDFYIP